MEIRGERECRSCGTRWSYYETGTVECPACGSVHSVGVDDEPRLHTATGVALDLQAARAAAADRPVAETAEMVAETTREYVGQRGFVAGGDLQPLDDEFLAAMELRQAADEVRRGLAVAVEEERYLLQLLTGADRGERPSPGDVPTSMRQSRGLAYVTAVERYRRDVRKWLDRLDRTAVPARARATFERLGEHCRRVAALDGDVPPGEANRLVAAARDLASYLVEGDEAALDAARERLDALE